MTPLAVLLVAGTLGVDYGWQPIAGGAGIEYIIRLEPELLAALQRGEDVASDLPPYVRNIRSYRITAVTGPLPHEGEPPPIELASGFDSRPAPFGAATYATGPTSGSSPYGPATTPLGTTGYGPSGTAGSLAPAGMWGTPGYASNWNQVTSTLAPVAPQIATLPVPVPLVFRIPDPSLTASGTTTGPGATIRRTGYGTTSDAETQGSSSAVWWVLFALLVSIAANFYLGFIGWEARDRYRWLAQQQTVVS